MEKDGWGNWRVFFGGGEETFKRHLNNVTFHQEIIIAWNVDGDIWLAGGTILMK